MCAHQVNTTVYVFFFVSIVVSFSTTNRMKNRTLIIIEPQAHKKLNPSLRSCGVCSVLVYIDVCIDLVRGDVCSILLSTMWSEIFDLFLS